MQFDRGKLRHRGARGSSPWTATQAFGFVARNCGDVAEQGAGVGDYRIAVEGAGCGFWPALAEGFYLPLESHASALGALGPLRTHN
jgi:hypothetical protein